MKAKEFVEILAQKHDTSIKEMQSIVDNYWDLIVSTIKKGDEVVQSHGKFILKKRPAREGRNPITGETVKIPAKVVPTFRPNKKLKDSVAT